MTNPSLPHAFGFYGILTEPVRGYEYCTKLLVDHGIAVVQLRMKDRPLDEVRKIAEMMRRVTRNTVTRFMVNDYPDVTRDVGADGVHLGQNDIPIENARAIVGQNALIGLSTHSPAQTADSCARLPDYIGIGPVFPTPTKKIPDPPIGIEGMKSMLALATVPAVVLGNITLENLPAILEAGARNFSMVRPINAAEDPEKVLNGIQAVYDSCCPDRTLSRE